MGTSPAKKQAIKLLRKYDKMRLELHAVERELTRAVLAYATEQKLGFYDKDKFRVMLMVEAEMQAKRRKAA